MPYIKAKKEGLAVKKLRMILTMTLTLIICVGMAVNVAASGGEVNLSTTVNGQERQIYFPADSEAAIAYHRDVTPLLPNGRGQMSDAAIAAMENWKSKYVTSQAEQFVIPRQTTPSNSAEILTDNELKAYADKVFELVNAEREKAGVPTLDFRDDIAEAAILRAQEIVSSYTHTRLDGSKFSSVFDEMGVRKKESGENIYTSPITPEAAVNGWMASNGHRNNILKEKYTATGIGIYQDKAGVLHWVQLFIEEK